MYLKAGKSQQFILAGIVMLTLMLGVLILAYPPALFPDPSWGIQVMRSMLSGGGFNLAITPSQANIAQNNAAYLTWWSPGQYLLPYFFKIITGFNLGRCTSITILFCYLSGIWGFYSFFRKIGFSAVISALSIAFIACQQFYYIPFIFYNGGETLLFGFLGWFLYGCFSFTKLNWKVIVFVLLTGWIGFCCKSAFLWMYASGLLCLWANSSSGFTNWRQWLKNGFILALPAIVSLSAIYQFFLSKGGNPASASHGMHLSVEALGFPLGAPLLSGFSVDDLFQGLLYHVDGAIIGPGLTIMVLVLTALLSIGLFVAIIKYIPNKPYKLAVSIFYTISFLFFSSVYLRQLDISYEGRHLRIVGLLFIPGAIYLFSLAKPGFKALFILLWLGIAFTSIKYVVVNYKYNVKSNAHGPSGITQLFIDQPALNYLVALDKQHHNDAVFAFTSADLGLEIMHNRIITLQDMSGASAGTYTENNLYEGHAGPLFVLLPAGNAANGNVDIIRKCFPGYANFSIKKLSKGYILVSAL